MLSNRLYIARISQPTWDIDTAGNWPPLVDEDTFWRCQSLLRTDGLVVPKERNNPDFSLRGFVTCGHCKKQRQRFQSLLFPEGLQIKNSEVRTAVSP
jgi:hypothetical protein